MWEHRALPKALLIFSARHLPGYLGTSALCESLRMPRPLFQCPSCGTALPQSALLWTAANHAIACCIVGSCIILSVGVRREGGAERWACLLAGQSRADRFCALPSITRAAAAHFSFSFSFNIYDLFMCGCLLALLISYENLCFPFWLKLPSGPPSGQWPLSKATVATVVCTTVSIGSTVSNLTLLLAQQFHALLSTDSPSPFLSQSFSWAIHQAYYANVWQTALSTRLEQNPIVVQVSLLYAHNNNLQQFCDEAKI